MSVYVNGWTKTHFDISTPGVFLSGKEELKY